VAYGFGKRLGDGSFEVVYALDRPPRPLWTALSRLDMEHFIRENRISDYIHAMVGKYPKMSRFIYPENANDVLFDADYQHMGGESCVMCDLDKTVERMPERHDKKPKIHYSTIATGSSVVKHVPTRDDIRKQHKAICLEMEAAGLMNNFSCS
jgi:hypothetical protein